MGINVCKINRRQDNWSVPLPGSQVCVSTLATLPQTKTLFEVSVYNLTRTEKAQTARDLEGVNCISVSVSINAAVTAEIEQQTGRAGPL